MAATDRCTSSYEELFAIGTQPNTWCSVHGNGGYVNQSGDGAEGLSPSNDTSGQNGQGGSAGQNGAAGQGGQQDAIVILNEDQVWIPDPSSTGGQGDSSWSADTGWNTQGSDVSGAQNSPGNGNSDSIWNENNQPDIVILP